MSRIRTARLGREMKNLTENPPWGIECKPEKEDIFDTLEVFLKGPIGSPYENGTFKLNVTVPINYPMEPPLVKFHTPIYHPNIDTGGRICMDMLKMPPKGAWVPTATLESLFISIQVLLANPNPDDPLSINVAKEYKFDNETYYQNALRHTKKHAM